MAATIFEFFGYRADDRSDIAKHAADTEVCPISGETCLKWSRKSGQLAKVYPELFGGIRDGETPEVYRSVQSQSRA